MPAAYSLETRGAATASPAALKRRANRLGPRRVVAPGVHQNQLQKPRPRAGFFVTISCEMLRELWSGRRDVAPLGGIAQRTRFWTPFSAPHAAFGAPSFWRRLGAIFVDPAARFQQQWGPSGGARADC